MTIYRKELQRLISTALSDLEQAHQGGKTPNSPVSNNHYLVRWVTKSLKQQDFDRCVVADLTRWQKQGRSKGNQADLYSTFKSIFAFYQQFFPDGDGKVLRDSDIERFLEKMESLNWEVSTSEPLVDCGKVQIFTEGPNSLALCANQCDSCFETVEGQEEEILSKPMHWFVRGHHAGFITLAAEAGFMVHKVTDYKSSVKYHGEYIVFPNNEGTQLAEIPLGFIGS